MTGLLDIGKLRKTLTVRDIEFTIEGLTARGLFDLLDKFPEFRKLLSDAGVAVEPKQLFAQVPEAVTTVIAHVCGYRRAGPFDQDAERVARVNAEYDAAMNSAADLTLGEQTEIIKTAWDLTFPKGLQSFLEALEGVGAIGSGWVPATASPGPSNNVSPPDTQ